MTRPRTFLTNRRRRAAYVLAYAGVGVVLAIIAKLSVVPTAGCYVGFALLRLWLEARDE
jgi:hypothetical protein